MNNKEWAEEMVRLWREGHSLDQARAIVRKMMKEQKREELGDGNKRISTKGI